MILYSELIERLIKRECLPRITILHYAQLFDIEDYTHAKVELVLTDIRHVADLSVAVSKHYDRLRYAGGKRLPELEQAFNNILMLADTAVEDD